MEILDLAFMRQALLAALLVGLAAPLVGGITVSFAMELCVYPVLFYLWKRRSVPR